MSFPLVPAPLPRPSSGHRVWRVMLVTWLLLALVSASGVALVYRHLDRNGEVGDAIEHAVAKGPQGPLNILLLGSDTRDGQGNDIDGLTGGGERSDTAILLHVSKDRERAYGISLPRDALVTRPDCKTDDGVVPGGEDQMFNTAFSIGGPACTARTVETLTGLRVDHYVVVDFRGFRDMVDAVDGVQVCIPEEIDDSIGNIHLDAGTQTLRGRDALNYVRERHDVGDGSDIGRMKRQQAFMASMVSKVVSAGTLTRPDRVYSFLNAATKSLTVDPGLTSLSKLSGLGLQLRDTGLSGIKFISVPSAPAPQDPNRLVWTSDADRLWQRIKDDKRLGDFGDDAISAKDPSNGSKKGQGTTGGTKQTEPPTEAQQQAADSAGLCA